MLSEHEKTCGYIEIEMWAVFCLITYLDNMTKALSYCSDMAIQMEFHTTGVHCTTNLDYIAKVRVMPLLVHTAENFLRCMTNKKPLATWKCEDRSKILFTEAYITICEKYGLDDPAAWALARIIERQ